MPLMHEIDLATSKALLSQCQKDFGKQAKRIAELEAENARLREALTDIKDLSQFITHHSVGARIKDIASKAINPTSAGGLYDE